MNPKRPTPRHIINKMQKFKDKQRILKVAGEKQLDTYKGASTKLPVDFSKETLQARGIAKCIQSDEKARTNHEDYSTQQSYHL